MSPISQIWMAWIALNHNFYFYAVDVNINKQIRSDDTSSVHWSDPHSHSHFFSRHFGVSSVLSILLWAQIHLTKLITHVVPDLLRYQHTSMFYIAILSKRLIRATHFPSLPFKAIEPLRGFIKILNSCKMSIRSILVIL